MKKKCKYALLSIVVLMSIFSLAGCWDYKEIDKYSIVAGMAIDRDPETKKFLATVEVIDLILSGKQTEVKSKKISTEGDTIFDAVRNAIEISCKKLYYSHIKTIIISQDIAKEGVVEVLDWFFRDAETRIEANVLISKEKTAKQLLYIQCVNTEIHSFEIKDMLKSGKYLGKVPVIELYEFINTLGSEGVSAVLPTIGEIESAGKKKFELSGTAVFKGDKLVGFLDSEQTKYLLFVLDEIRGGLLVVDGNPEKNEPPVSLEIFNSKTKVKPVYKDGRVSISIEVQTEVAIGEQGMEKDYINEKGRDILKKDAEKLLEENIEKVIKKAQKDFGADIFGFGRVIKREMPELWKSMSEENKQEIFKNIGIDIKTNIDIRNSGLTSAPIKVGS